MNRANLIDEMFKIYEDFWDMYDNEKNPYRDEDFDWDAEVDNILTENHASENDSGEEGFASTMSDKDIENAINGLKEVTAKFKQMYIKSRSEVLDELFEVYNDCCELSDETFEAAEDILRKYNASEDDSDRKEGFAATMSTADVVKAIAEMKKLSADYRTERDSVQHMINALKSKDIDASHDYYEGYLDACKAIKKEFGIDIVL